MVGLACGGRWPAAHCPRLPPIARPVCPPSSLRRPLFCFVISSFSSFRSLVCSSSPSLSPRFSCRSFLVGDVRSPCLRGVWHVRDCLAFCRWMCWYVSMTLFCHCARADRDGRRRVNDQPLYHASSPWSLEFRCFVLFRCRAPLFWHCRLTVAAVHSFTPARIIRRLHGALHWPLVSLASIAVVLVFRLHHMSKGQPAEPQAGFLPGRHRPNRLIHRHGHGLQYFHSHEPHGAPLMSGVSASSSPGTMSEPATHSGTTSRVSVTLTSPSGTVTSMVIPHSSASSFVTPTTSVSTSSAVSPSSSPWHSSSAIPPSTTHTSSQAKSTTTSLEVSTVSTCTTSPSSTSPKPSTSIPTSILLVSTSPLASMPASSFSAPLSFTQKSKTCSGTTQTPPSATISAPVSAATSAFTGNPEPAMASVSVSAPYASETALLSQPTPPTPLTSTPVLTPSVPPTPPPPPVLTTWESNTVTGSSGTVSSVSSASSVPLTLSGPVSSHRSTSVSQISYSSSKFSTTQVSSFTTSLVPTSLSSSYSSYSSCSLSYSSSSLPPSTLPSTTLPSTSSTSSLSTTLFSPCTSASGSPYWTAGNGGGPGRPSTTATSSPTNIGVSAKNTAPTGKIAGGVVGGIAGLAVVVAVAFYLLYRYRLQKTSTAAASAVAAGAGGAGTGAGTGTTATVEAGAPREMSLQIPGAAGAGTSSGTSASAPFREIVGGMAGGAAAAAALITGHRSRGSKDRSISKPPTSPTPEGMARFGLGAGGGGGVAGASGVSGQGVGAGGETGFQKIRGRHIPSVLVTGGDGYDEYGGGGFGANSEGDALAAGGADAGAGAGAEAAVPAPMRRSSSSDNPFRSPTDPPDPFIDPRGLPLARSGTRRSSGSSSRSSYLFPSSSTPHEGHGMRGTIIPSPPLGRPPSAESGDSGSEGSGSAELVFRPSPAHAVPVAGYGEVPAGMHARRIRGNNGNGNGNENGNGNGWLALTRTPMSMVGVMAAEDPEPLPEPLPQRPWDIEDSQRGSQGSSRYSDG